jgi:hypothetical protein
MAQDSDKVVARELELFFERFVVRFEVGDAHVADGKLGSKLVPVGTHCSQLSGKSTACHRRFVQAALELGTLLCEGVAFLDDPPRRCCC